MALVVNNTPMAPANNSYASLAEADEYVATRISDEQIRTAWDDLDEELKSAYLVNGSRTLDSLCDWIGDKYSRDQGLKWPRVNAYVDGYVIDQITFPRPVIEATIEMAIWSMTNSGDVGVASNSQYDSIKVGPIAIDFNEGAGIASTSYFPDIVAILLRDYGGITAPELPSNAMMKQATLVRA
jgi:hypothetical protein